MGMKVGFVVMFFLTIIIFSTMVMQIINGIQVLDSPFILDARNQPKFQIISKGVSITAVSQESFTIFLGDNFLSTSVQGPDGLYTSHVKWQVQRYVELWANGNKPVRIDFHPKDNNLKIVIAEVKYPLSKTLSLIFSLWVLYCTFYPMVLLIISGDFIERS